MAHGYFEIDFERVCDTVQTALPVLLSQVAAAQEQLQASPTSSREHPQPG